MKAGRAILWNFPQYLNPAGVCSPRDVVWGSESRSGSRVERVGIRVQLNIPRWGGNPGGIHIHYFDKIYVFRYVRCFYIRLQLTKSNSEKTTRFSNFASTSLKCKVTPHFLVSALKGCTNPMSLGPWVDPLWYLNEQNNTNQSLVSIEKVHQWLEERYQLLSGRTADRALNYQLNVNTDKFVKFLRIDNFEPSCKYF